MKNKKNMLALMIISVPLLPSDRQYSWQPQRLPIESSMNRQESKYSDSFGLVPLSRYIDNDNKTQGLSDSDIGDGDDSVEGVGKKFETYEGSVFLNEKQQEFLNAFRQELLDMKFVDEKLRTLLYNEKYGVNPITPLKSLQKLSPNDKNLLLDILLVELRDKIINKNK